MGLRNLVFICGAIASLAIASPAMAADAHVIFVNRSDWNVEQIRGSPVYEHSYGSDRLGDDIIEPGYQVRVNFADDNDECEYDIYIKLENGTTNSRRINVCEVSRVIIYNRSTVAD